MIEYAFWPHKSNDNIQQKAAEYEHDCMILRGSTQQPKLVGEDILNVDPCRQIVTSVQFRDGRREIHAFSPKTGELQIHFKL